MKCSQCQTRDASHAVKIGNVYHAVCPRHYRDMMLIKRVTNRIWRETLKPATDEMEVEEAR